MGIVGFSLFVLALIGPIHLFNIVSWVEKLQSRFLRSACLPHISLKVSWTWTGATARPPRRKRLSGRQKGVLLFHNVILSTKQPPDSKSGTFLCVEVLSDQPGNVEGDGSHCSHLPHHPHPVQVRDSCHALIEIHVLRPSSGHCRQWWWWYCCREDALLLELKLALDMHTMS